MKDGLTVGLEGSEDHLVTGDMSPPHLPMKVLSTPDMIRLMEQPCLIGVSPHLDQQNNFARNRLVPGPTSTASAWCSSSA